MDVTIVRYGFSKVAQRVYSLFETGGKTSRTLALCEKKSLGIEQKDGSIFR